MSNTKISLMNCIGTPTYSPGNNTLEISDSGANIHLSKQSTTTTTHVIISNEMTVRLQDVITMDSSHIETLQLPGLSNQARQINIFPKMKTSPVISLGVLCDDGFTITLYKKYTPVQNNGQEIIKGTRNKKTGTCEVILETQQSEAVENKILAQTNKP